MFYFYTMKHKFLVILVLGSFFSCSKKAPIENILPLNGYWQITKAETSEGKKIEYPVNVDYDYFELKGTSGFHKKVRWQPMDKFLVDAIQEKVSVNTENDATVLHFESKFGKRAETLKALSNSEMTISTPDQSIFYYKKVEDTLVKKYGKKNE